MDIPGSKDARNSKHFYWSIIQGEFCMKVRPDTEGARPRINKNEVTVYEITKSRLSGKLHDINVREGKFGVELIITLIPQEGYRHIITIPKKSRQFTSFMQRLIGINMNHPVELMAYEMDGNRGIAVFQDGIKIPNQYQQKVDDKEVYLHGFPEWPANFKKLPERDQKNHLYDIEDFFGKVLEQWRDEYAPAEDSRTTEAVEAEEQDEEGPTDNLPF